MWRMGKWRRKKGTWDSKFSILSPNIFSSLAWKYLLEMFISSSLINAEHFHWNLNTALNNKKHHPRFTQNFSVSSKVYVMLEYRFAKVLKTMPKNILSLNLNSFIILPSSFLLQPALLQIPILFLVFCSTAFHSWLLR